MSLQAIIAAEPGKQELFITREFDAPRELVYRAFSEPDLLKLWMGPEGMEMEIEHLDNRSGGSYRFLHRDAAGNVFAFNGAIHEVEAPSRVIRTFEFEGLPERGHVSLEFLTLEELPNQRCRIHIQSVFRSVADRDGLVMSGMEKGMNEGFVKLDAMLKQQFNATN